MGNFCTRKQRKDFYFVHFNDVYDIEGTQTEPVGGVARFKTALNRYADVKPLVLFSGDVFAPSTLSTLYKGEQMIEPLKQLNIDVACLGNHDLDYDLEHTTSLIKRTPFPWLCSNLYNMTLDEGENCIAGCKEYKIVQKNNFKIGFMGLAEEDWIACITEIPSSILAFEDFVKTAKRLVKFFKEQKCDIIVALTHMRTHNDIKLAEEVPEIDLILGGHDHTIEKKQVNQSLIIKSGTDFKDFSFNHFEVINNPNEISKPEAGVFVIKNKYKITVDMVQVTQEFEPEPKLLEHVNFYMKQCEFEMCKTIGYTLEVLETRFSQIRTKETNFSNFYADILKEECNADISFINAGTIRSDQLIPKGKLTMKDLSKALPWDDIIIVKEITGKILHEMIENGVSKYPVFDGRFPMVSGIQFKFDPKQNPGNRVKKEDITVNGAPIDYDKKLKLATRYFTGQGKDGYEMLINTRNIIDNENGTEQKRHFLNFFASLKNKTQFEAQPENSDLLLRDSSKLKFQQMTRLDKKQNPEQNVNIKSKYQRYQEKGLISNEKELFKEFKVENENFIVIQPKLENRIICIE